MTGWCTGGNESTCSRSATWGHHWRYPGTGIGQPSGTNVPFPKCESNWWLIASPGNFRRHVRAGLIRGSVGPHRCSPSAPLCRIAIDEDLSPERETEAIPRWDPDNPWETVQGVPPVLLPPVEQRVDPGPAIGLSEVRLKCAKELGRAVVSCKLCDCGLSPRVPARADDIRNDQWHLQALEAEEANRISTGRACRRGCYRQRCRPHRDLRQNLLMVDPSYYSKNDNGQGDEDGHGTVMASLIAAHGGTGGSRRYWDRPSAQDSSRKRLRLQEQGISVSRRRPESNGQPITERRVINILLPTAPSIALKKAVETAAAMDVVVVAGVGNKPDFLQFGYPAAMPGVLAVGSTDRSNKHAAFSITGEQMQICAPGVDIESPRLKTADTRSQTGRRRRRLLFRGRLRLCGLSFLI